jgi:hypothetical protein
MEVLLDIGWWSFGLFDILSARTEGQAYMESEDTTVEDQWGFGQVIPMLLILLPMINAWEVWYGKYLPFRIPLAIANVT